MKMITKLRYSDTLSLSSGVTTSVRVYNAGGIYDPDVLPGGHQPRGFDQLMPLYDHFVVIGAKIRVQFVHAPASTNNSIVGISLRDDVTTSTLINDYVEGTKDNHKVLYLRDKEQVVTQWYSPKKFLGISKPLASNELKGTIASNPSESAYFHVYNGPLNGGTSGIVEFNMDIEYIVAFIEPKQPAQS